MYHSVDLGRASDLSDDALVTAFEDGTLPPELFRHVDHVRLAYVYLRRLGLLDTLRRYSDGLRAFAEHHGDPGRYHETVTWALVILIHQRMALSPDTTDWPSFAARHPDLLRWKGGAFFEYYGPEVLESPLARKTFVLPR